MATIEVTLKVGPNCVLMANTTTEREKLSPLKPGEEVRVKIITGKRSLSSNALSHAWYNEAATQTNDTPQNVRSFCKLNYGVPILIAESEHFADRYNRSIRDTLNYEQKLLAMDLLDVTSLMNKGQMNRYLNDMQRDYANRGIILETPEDAEFAKWVAQQARQHQ